MEVGRAGRPAMHLASNSVSALVPVQVQGAHLARVPAHSTVPETRAVCLERGTRGLFDLALQVFRVPLPRILDRTPRGLPPPHPRLRLRLLRPPHHPPAWVVVILMSDR